MRNRFIITIIALFISVMAMGQSMRSELFVSAELVPTFSTMYSARITDGDRVSPMERKFLNSTSLINFMAEYGFEFVCVEYSVESNKKVYIFKLNYKDLEQREIDLILNAVGLKEKKNNS